MIRILIIDDQNLVLKSLKVLFESEEQLEIVGTALDARKGIELIEQLKPDVAIVDLIMPQSDGIETTCLIAQKYPQTRVIIYTGSHQHMLSRAISAGAKGYLLKNSSVVDLAAAVHAVHRNNIYIGEGILDQVQLLPTDSQKQVIKNVKSWLAKEILHWWRDCACVQASIAEKIIGDLSLDQAGLLQMKKFLCHQEDKKTTLIEEAILEIEMLFASVEDSAKPERKLKESRHLILNIINGNSTSDRHFQYTLQKNFGSLQLAKSNQLSQIISALSEQASPLPLLAFFQSIQKSFLNYQKFLNQEFESCVEKRESALHSFEHILKSRKKLIHKQDICKKAAILACQNKIDAEIYSLIARIITEAIELLEAQIDILNRTNMFLLESIEHLGQHQTNPVTFIPYMEELQRKISIKELQKDIERLIGYSLNQWGVDQSVSHAEVNKHLLDRLEPITCDIYAYLRREALDISFLKYAQDSNQQL